MIIAFRVAVKWIGFCKDATISIRICAVADSAVKAQNTIWAI